MRDDEYVAWYHDPTSTEFGEGDQSRFDIGFGAGFQNVKLEP